MYSPLGLPSLRCKIDLVELHEVHRGPLLHIIRYISVNVLDMLYRIYIHRTWFSANRRLVLCLEQELASTFKNSLSGKMQLSLHIFPSYLCTCCCRNQLVVLKLGLIWSVEKMELSRNAGRHCSYCLPGYVQRCKEGDCISEKVITESWGHGGKPCIHTREVSC